MRKSLFFICLCLFVVASGYKKEVIIPNRTIITTLDSGDWIKFDGGLSYTAAINMPEIDDYVNENHGILVYFSFQDGTYEALPEVYNGISYSYITRAGQIVIEIQSSDGISVVTPPGGVTVKIVLIESY